eukprot:UN00487
MRGHRKTLSDRSAQVQNYLRMHDPHLKNVGIGARSQRKLIFKTS